MIETNTDPRSALPPGIYRAAVTKVKHGYCRHPNGDRYWGIESIEYSLPECGDWRWAIYDDSAFTFGPRAPQSFLVNAERNEHFDFEKR